MIEKTPDEIINELLKELESPSFVDLNPANTEKFVYIPITMFNDILQELKEIKEILNGKKEN